jgi:hypothetical protein
MTTHLVVFGTADYTNAVNSLLISAGGYFDVLHSFGQHDIDVEFYSKHINILSKPRGAGYWLWKPYFIHKVLCSIADGDIVFYVDAGNVFLQDPSFLYNKFNKDIILFDNRDGMSNGKAAQNFISCKRDTFVLMDCDSAEYINGVHLNASYQIYKKSNASVSFVKTYLDYCVNEQIITDAPNLHGDNYPGYYDHRHDQSILSLLAIKNNIEPLIDPSEWGNRSSERGFGQLFNHHRNKNFVL